MSKTNKNQVKRNDITHKVDRLRNGNIRVIIYNATTSTERIETFPHYEAYEAWRLALCYGKGAVCTR